MKILYGHTDFKSQILTIPLQPQFDLIYINDLVDVPCNQTNFQKVKQFFTEVDVVKASIFSGFGLVKTILICILP